MSLFAKYLHTNPKVTYLPDYDPTVDTNWQGVKSLWYEGAEYQGKQTKVFAYIGYPEMKEGEKVPAVVLVHGGGGHAFAHWIKLWNERGYAAIAMDTEGYFPAEDKKGLTGTEGEPKEWYVHDSHTAGPKNDEMKDDSLPLENQWIYHAIVDTILAHNILKADARIDKDKIGICGVSWGSVITSLAIGYDTDYAFALPIYGSAYLEYADTNVCSAFKSAATREQWSAADRLSNASFPVLWHCGLYDAAFCSYSNSLSYLDTKRTGSVLSIQEDLFHSHNAAWSREEGYYFADCVLAGKQPFVVPVEEPKGFGKVEFEISIPDHIEKVEARVIYFTEDFNFNQESQPTNKGCTAPAIVSETIVTAEIPQEAFCYYVEFKMKVNGTESVSTTSWVYPE